MFSAFSFRWSLDHNSLLLWYSIIRTIPVNQSTKSPMNRKVIHVPRDWKWHFIQFLSRTAKQHTQHSQFWIISTLSEKCNDSSSIWFRWWKPRNATLQRQRYCFTSLSNDKDYKWIWYAFWSLFKRCIDREKLKMSSWCWCICLWMRYTVTFFTRESGVCMHTK